MKKIYVIGASSCYGMDLRPPKGSSLTPADYRLMHSFGGLVAGKLGKGLVNASYPAMSNTSIARKLVADVDADLYDLVIVGISVATMREHWDVVDQKFVNIVQAEHHFPPEFMRMDKDGNPTHYSPSQLQMYLDYRDNITLQKAIADFENDILAIQDALDRKNVKYVLLMSGLPIPNEIDADGYSTRENSVKHFADFMPRIDLIKTEKWLGWDEFNIVDSTRAFPKGKTGHMLEEGHQFVAEMLYHKIVSESLC